MILLQVRENPRGELGYYLVSDGKPNLYRLKVRSPCFTSIGILPAISEGTMIADLVASDGPQPAAKPAALLLATKPPNGGSHSSEHLLKDVRRIVRLDPVFAAPRVDEGPVDVGQLLPSQGIS